MTMENFDNVFTLSYGFNLFLKFLFYFKQKQPIKNHYVLRLKLDGLEELNIR